MGCALQPVVNVPVPVVVLMVTVVVVATTSDVAITDSPGIVPLDVVSVAALEFQSIALCTPRLALSAPAVVTFC